MMSYFGAKLSASNSIKLHLYFQLAPEMPLISQTEPISPQAILLVNGVPYL
jgi:hypothetical protein